MSVALADENVDDDHASSSPFHNLAIEQAIIGGVIASKLGLTKVEAILSPSDFYWTVHQTLYDYCMKVRDEGGSLSLRLVIAKLEQCGQFEFGEVTPPAYAARLMAEASVLDELPYLARTIRDMAQRRELFSIGADLQDVVKAEKPINDVAISVVEKIDAVIASRLAQYAKPRLIGAAAVSAVERMQNAISSSGEPGLPSGLSSLDRMTGGFNRGDFIVIAGRPGMGKSAFGISMARFQAGTGLNVLMFSLEMTGEDIADRMIADAVWTEHDPIPYQTIRRGKVSVDHQRRITDAARSFDKLPLLLETQSGLTLSQITARARKHHAQLERQGRQLDVVLIDHMHLIRASNRYAGKPVHELTEISNGLKVLAKELNVPVIALAQLNRGVEHRDNKRPVMADLRESGAIEQDADMILLPFREAYYLTQPTSSREEELARAKRFVQVENIIELNIAKQRNGPTGNIVLMCDITANVFRDYSEGM